MSVFGNSWRLLSLKSPYDLIGEQGQKSSGVVKVRFFGSERCSGASAAVSRRIVKGEPIREFFDAKLHEPRNISHGSN